MDAALHLRPSQYIGAGQVISQGCILTARQAGRRGVCARWKRRTNLYRVQSERQRLEPHPDKDHLGSRYSICTYCHSAVCRIIWQPVPLCIVIDYPWKKKFHIFFDVQLWFCLSRLPRLRVHVGQNFGALDHEGGFGDRVYTAFLALSESCGSRHAEYRSTGSFTWETGLASRILDQ